MICMTYSAGKALNDLKTLAAVILEEVWTSETKKMCVCIFLFSFFDFNQTTNLFKVHSNHMYFFIVWAKKDT